jgi:glycosyltransferase involved in cell wall biosynthesis
VRSTIRVCLVSPKAYPLFNPECKGIIGGAEVDLYLLAVELAKDPQYDVGFITADYGQNAVEVVDNVKVIKSLDFKKNALNGAIQVWRAMKLSDADIYVQEAVSEGTFLVSLFCKLRKKVFVYRTAHQDECNGSYLKRHPLRGRLFMTALRWADVVLTQNNIDRDNLLKTSHLDSTVVRGGHHMPELAHTEREFVLWVARSADFKRPRLFLDLARQFPNEKFVMICSKAWGDSNYDQLAADAKKIANIAFFQQVPFQDLSDYFNRAKVFVCTSQSEGFPNTYIHAWTNGTPILSLEVNPDGILDQFACGICCKGDLGQLADSLRSLLTDSRYVELGRNARRYAEEFHDIEKVTREYKKLFNNVIGSDRERN